MHFHCAVEGTVTRIGSRQLISNIFNLSAPDPRLHFRILYRFPVFPPHSQFRSQHRSKKRKLQQNIPCEFRIPIHAIVEKGTQWLQLIVQWSAPGYNRADIFWRGGAEMRKGIVNTFFNWHGLAIQWWTSFFFIYISQILRLEWWSFGCPCWAFTVRTSSEAEFGQLSVDVHVWLVWENGSSVSERLAVPILRGGGSEVFQDLIFHSCGDKNRERPSAQHVRAQYSGLLLQGVLILQGLRIPHNTAGFIFAQFPSH